MARGKPFEKGNKASKGRIKGSPNKTTAEAKALFNSVMNDEIEHIKESLDIVRLKDPAKYLEILAKYLNYVYPKGLDLSSDGEKMQWINVIVQNEADKLKLEKFSKE